MNVGQLEEICKNIVDKNMDIMIVQHNDEFKFSQAECAIIEDVRFGIGQVPKKDQPIITCLVITDNSPF